MSRAVSDDLLPCPWCAEPIRSGARICRYCNRNVTEQDGSSSAAALSPQSAALPSTTARAQACPRCQRLETLHVATLVLGGTSSGSVQSHYGGASFDGDSIGFQSGSAVSFASSSTHLASRLTLVPEFPPAVGPKPEKPNLLLVAIVLSVVPAGMWAVDKGFALEWGAKVHYWAWGIAGGLFLIGLFEELLPSTQTKFEERQRAFDEGKIALAKWHNRQERRLAMWQRLLLCTACGSVSDPQSGRSASIDQMDELLARA